MLWQNNKTFVSAFYPTGTYRSNTSHRHLLSVPVPINLSHSFYKMSHVAFSSLTLQDVFPSIQPCCAAIMQSNICFSHYSIYSPKPLLSIVLFFLINRVKWWQFWIYFQTADVCQITPRPEVSSLGSSKLSESAKSPWQSWCFFLLFGLMHCCCSCASSACISDRWHYPHFHVW